MLRLGVAVLLALAGTAIAEEKTSCIAPAVVTELEAKIQQLESTNAEWTQKLDTAESEWRVMKEDLTAKLSKEEEARKAAVELAASAQDQVDSQTGSIEKELKAAHSANEELKTKSEKLQKEYKNLQIEFEKEKLTVKKQKDELKDTKTKATKLSRKVKDLEKEIKQTLEKNEALRVELESIDGKVTLAALLSFYYDEGIELTGTVVDELRTRASEWQSSSSALNDATEMLEATKNRLVRTSSEIYRQHLAESVDPLLDQVTQAATPHINKYKPVVLRQLENLQAQARKQLMGMQRQARDARIQAIANVKQHKPLAPYASTIVDGMIVVVMLPVVYFLTRWLLELIYSILYFVVWLATCGCCFGRCSKRRQKSKRKPRNGAPGAGATKQSTASPNATVSNSATRRKSKMTKVKK